MDMDNSFSATEYWRVRKNRDYWQRLAESRAKLLAARNKEIRELKSKLKAGE
jgi:hypothetical protein